jgi:hypothetical protein
MSHKALSLFLSSSLLFGLSPLTPAHSSTFVLDKKFTNCEALNKVYPGGVAKNKAATNKGGATSYTPLVKPKIYKANVSKDRDKDGIACER